MIHIYFDPIDSTYLIKYDEMLSDGWFNCMPTDLNSIVFTSDKGYLEIYDCKLIHTFNTIDEYHQYVEDYPEDFL